MHGQPMDTGKPSARTTAAHFSQNPRVGEEILRMNFPEIDIDPTGWMMSEKLDGWYCEWD